MKSVKKIVPLVIVTLLIILLLAGILFANGIIWFNTPSMTAYPVRGVDVSVYQGEINWEILASQKIEFVFIKATEGSSYADEKFVYNWKEADKTSLRLGAYHFFSFDSSGKNQAENFISTVPKRKGMLPPAVDIEFYADKEKKPPDVEITRRELQVLLDELEKEYGAKPILYATEKAYNLYLAGQFLEYPIWIRNIFSKAQLEDGRKWTFWQYSDHGRLLGYDGEERFIDLNVFNGTSNELDNLRIK